MKFLCCSLASYGFVYPAIGIACELRRRGHEVAFVTGPVFGPLLQQLGFERIPRGPNDGPSFQVETWSVDVSVAIQVKHIEYALERFHPDVLIGQLLTLGPLLVGERKHLPTAIIGLSSYLWPRSSLTQDGRSLSEREARLAWRYAEMIDHYNAARRLFRLPMVDVPPEENPLLGDLFLLQSVPLLAGDPARFPDRVRMVGACTWEPDEEDHELAQWLEQSHHRDWPIVYLQHGRSFDHPRFWTNCVEALREQPIRVAAAVGRMEGSVGAVPDNVLARNHVPQQQVLREAQAVICSGTTTAVLGALTHGLPALLLPGGGEQIEVAEDCEQAGVVLQLAVDADVETIGASVRQLLGDHTLRQNAERLQRAFAQFGGCASAAACLERLTVHL